MTLIKLKAMLNCETSRGASFATFAVALRGGCAGSVDRGAFVLTPSLRDLTTGTLAAGVIDPESAGMPEVLYPKSLAGKERIYGAQRAREVSASGPNA